MAKITRQEAIEKIKEWALYLEATDPDADGFGEAIEPLILPVVNERLDFNIDSCTFTMKLIKPIVGEKSNTEVVEIHEPILSEQKVVQRYKDSEGIDRTEALLAKCAGIALGEASKLGTRDIGVISAVVTVFFS